MPKVRQRAESSADGSWAESICTCTSTNDPIAYCGMHAARKPRVRTSEVTLMMRPLTAPSATSFPNDFIGWNVRRRWCVPLLLLRPARCGWFEVFCGGGETAVTYQRLPVAPQLSLLILSASSALLLDTNGTTSTEEKILLVHMTNKFDIEEFLRWSLHCNVWDSLTYHSTYYVPTTVLSWYTSTTCHGRWT
jgi:hypothetical protein